MWTAALCSVDRVGQVDRLQVGMESVVTHSGTVSMCPFVSFELCPCGTLQLCSCDFSLIVSLCHCFTALHVSHGP